MFARRPHGALVPSSRGDPPHLMFANYGQVQRVQMRLATPTDRYAALS